MLLFDITTAVDEDVDNDNDDVDDELAAAVGALFKWAAAVVVEVSMSLN